MIIMKILTKSTLEQTVEMEGQLFCSTIKDVEQSEVKQ